jgi:fibronectin-binding autotransporter adhesin
MKAILNQLRTLAALAVSLTTLNLATADTVVWSGGGATQNWSLGGADGNWTGSAAPGASDDVKFWDTGTDFSLGNVNNIVDTTTTINSLTYANSNNFHTTMIDSGQTLTIANGLTVGTGTSNGANFLLTATIEGVAGQGSVLALTGGNMFIGQPAEAGGNHPATLDLSLLDTFNGNFGRLLVGVGDSTLRRLLGTLKLAATNRITLSGSATNLMVGVNHGNNANNSSVSYLMLGWDNTINANSISVGADKQQGNLSFNNLWATPFLFLRGSDGSSRVSAILIGDNAAQTTSGNPTTGVVDLSGGTVDATADTVYVGRGLSGSGSGAATGTLTIGAGILDVNTLEAGYQNSASATAIVSGTINVNYNLVLNTNATLVVNTDLRLARYTGTGTVPQGDLNISGGMVRAANITSGGGTTTITVTSGGTLMVTNVSGSIGTVEAPVGTLNMADSTLQLAVNGTTTNVVVTTLTTYSSTNNTIDIASLPVITSYPAELPLISYLTLNNDDFLLGTLPAAAPAYQGYLTNNSAHSTIDLVITNGPITSRALVWRGTPSGDWNTSTANWLFQGSPTAYSQNDAVLFDDTASGSTTVNLAIDPAPFTLTVSNLAKSYTFTGSGGLGGATGLDKEGSAMLTLNHTGADTFTGDVTLGGGTVRLGAADRLPTNSSVTLADISGALLDLNNQDQTIGALNGGGSSGGNVTLGNGTLAFGDGNGTYNGVISGAGTVVQSGGGTQVLGGANLYSGGTLVSTGTLAVANLTGSGTGPGYVLVNSNATFALGAGGPGGSVAAGTITNHGSIVFNRSDDFTLANVIAGDGNLTKNNTNTVLISSAGAYTGNTTITAGALRISNPGALGDATGATSIQNDPTARLELLGGITLAETLNVAQKQNAAGPAPCILNAGGVNTLAGQLNLNAGGTYWIFEAAAGELVISGGATNTTATSATRTVWLRGAASGLWNSSIDNGGYAPALTAVRKDDTGTWTLAGANSYSGVTTVSNGTLLVNGSLNGTSAVNVEGGTLGGTGTIQAPVFVDVNGTLSPGTSIGTLIISNNLTLSGTNVMEVSHSGADKVAGLSSVQLGGTLQVTVIGTLAGGEAFKLFDATDYSGDFAVYDLPALNSPLYWDTNSVPVDGTLRVAGVPQIGGITVSGTNVIMQGSGGPAYSNYVVLTSTNVALPLSNWMRLATNQFDDQGSFRLTNGMIPAVTQQFYLLQVP